MGHETDDDERSSSSRDYRRQNSSSSSRRDFRECKLAPDENSFSFRKSRMKKRVQKEKKMRDARAAIEARKRRSGSRRSNNRFDNDEEIEESGTTEDFHNTSHHHHQESKSDEMKENSEIVPFAAAEPLPDTNNNPSDEDRDGPVVNTTAPNGTVSASSAEVVISAGEGRRLRRVFSGSSSSEDETEDESVLSLGAEATPIHDTHRQHEEDENLERVNNQEPRERQRRRNSNRRRSSSSERKNRHTFSRKCKIITFVILVILFGGAGTFFALRGSPTPNSLPSIPAKQISIPPTFAPSSDQSPPKTDPPTAELVYEAPLPEECETISNGGRLEGEDGLRVNRYNVELEVELTSTTSVEEAINVIANATRKILIPDLVGCFGAHRSLLGHSPLRRNHAKRSPRYNPHRYAIANGNSTIRLAEGRSCNGIHGGPCLGIDVILHLAAKNADEKQFVFQSLIIEIFGTGDLATSLNLNAFMTWIKLVDVKINVETDAPSEVPTNLPTLSPSHQPSDYPSLVPSKGPTKAPSQSPSDSPSLDPTILPSQRPTELPTGTPTTGIPTSDPSAMPSLTPTQSPSSSANPTVSPSVSPSHAPTSTVKPSISPTVTQGPTVAPLPTRKPTVIPSEEPTPDPSTSLESRTEEPSSESLLPTEEPTKESDLVPAVRVPTSGPLDIVVRFEPTT